MDKKNKIKFVSLIDKVSKLNADESITVKNFGKNHDLSLTIIKDSLYDGTPQSNQATVHIRKNGVSLENTWFLNMTELEDSLYKYYHFDFKNISSIGEQRNPASLHF